jgi:surface antigen
MEYNDFKQYTNNTNLYTADEVAEMEPMTDNELEQYQNEVEHDSGNLSEWDHCRAIITFKKKIFQLEQEKAEWSVKENWYKNAIATLYKEI